MPANAKKLKIIRGIMSGNTASFDEGNAQDVLTLPFNPTEYAIDKKNTFSQAAIPGLASPIIQFSSGEARTLSLEILLDSYMDGSRKDLRTTFLAKIDRFLAIDGEAHAPTPCKVIWGSLQFVGVLESAAKRFIMFLEDGTPVRARVTLAFREYVPVDIQLREIVRASPDKLKARVVSDGDSLWRIAAETYGDAGMWKAIAEANALDDPMRLRTGALLTIPRLEPREGGRLGSQ
jgi:hypothetical protein